MAPAGHRYDSLLLATQLKLACFRLRDAGFEFSYLHISAGRTDWELFWLSSPQKSVADWCPSSVQSLIQLIEWLVRAALVSSQFSEPLCFSLCSPWSSWCGTGASPTSSPTGRTEAWDSWRRDSRSVAHVYLHGQTQSQFTCPWYASKQDHTSPCFH